MAQSAKKVAAWLVAHPKLLPEEAVATAGPWPSLEVGDFLVWAREQEDYPKEVIRLVEQLWRECLWAYDNWTKAAHADAQNMLIDLLHNCRGSDQYHFTAKFLRDYGQAHGYFTQVPEEEETPPWRQGSTEADAPARRVVAANTGVSSSEPPPLPPAKPAAKGKKK